MATATAFELIEQQITSRDERRVRDTIAALHRAHYTKDASAAASLYADNAAISNLAPPLEQRGINVEEKQAWMDSWETPIEIAPRDLKITVSGDFAFAHCFLEMNGTKKGPEGAVRFWMRATMAFERIRGSWRIVHEHTSVPFYMDGTLRPAFDLHP
ncbi:MAG TPA: nuclear transport factor 2 family protein [Terracidiphilus sp.]|jgi:ketosteroid isomerase-like protein|nr:nuclear transport factor 2 family protein [Terracidiphilus sp.]